MTASNITPAYDHIVIVVEENHALNEIIGNPQAPYLNSLANGGAVLTNYRAVTHPSEPNYFALYAGSTFGVADDGNYNESDPTLATVLQSGGKSFLGFAETASPRKHNPWESFPEGTSVERDFSAFPATAGGNFAALPDVAFVVPDLNDDMHDGSVATGDQWLKTNIDAYAQWAITHHSLLVVVWDEDDASAGNQVPAIVYGANVNPGSYSEAYNHYDLLSTLAGSSALTAPNNGALAGGLGSGIFSASLSHWLASVDPGTHPAGWLPTLTGDFNHDGASDLFWFNASTTDAEVWTFSNGKWASSSDIGLHPAGWQPVASGDFNYDGAGDLLWFNAATGDAEIWKIWNGKWAGSVDLGRHPPGWQPVGAGDFNHDGTSDVLWFNTTTNDIDLWKIANGQWAGSIDIGTHPAGYQPVGIGDFNHDGTSDILWFNANTRDVDLWLIQSGQWAGSVDIGTHPAGWQPAGVGDFNHDGTSDVLWFNATSGDAEIWLITNGHWAASVDLGSHPAGWIITGVGDFNHDGGSDILWRETATGRIDDWLLASS